MFNVFGWVRAKAAEAVVLGVEDGVKLVSEGGDVPDLAALRARLAAAVGAAPALPAIEAGEVEAVKGKKKLAA